MRFVGARLQLGRTYRGLTLADLADVVSSSVPVLSRIEHDKKEPSEDLVEAIAESLGFKPEFFYRPLSDRFTQKECSFRKKVATPQKVKERILAQGTLLAEFVRELRKVVRLPSPNIPRFPNRWSREAVEEAASDCRAHWGYGDGPIGNMVRVLEHAGVIVTRLHDESDSIDAFSRPGEVPFVVLNDAKGSGSRARMDLAHELGHLVMHDGETGPEEETQADQFGAAFLLPEGAFGRHFQSYGRTVDWPQLFDMKRHWKVSVALIIRRAFDLRLISAVEYRRRFRYIHYRGWHRGEPFEPPLEPVELLNNALRLVLQRTSCANQIVEALGWTHETFTDLTGITLADVEADDPKVIPLDRARLALA